jgi:hypothetical protein
MAWPTETPPFLASRLSREDQASRRASAGIDRAPASWSRRSGRAIGALQSGRAFRSRRSGRAIGALQSGRALGARRSVRAIGSLRSGRALGPRRSGRAIGALQSGRALPRHRRPSVRREPQLQEDRRGPADPMSPGQSSSRPLGNLGLDAPSECQNFPSGKGCPHGRSRPHSTPALPVPSDR